MPPKTKRQIAGSLNLARKTKQSQARKAKQSRTMHGESSRVCINEANELDELLSATDALDADNSNMMSDTDHITETFYEDWVSHLD